MHHEHASDCYWREVLRRVLCCDHVRHIARVVTYQFKGVSFTAKGDHMALVLKDTEVPGTVTVTVAFVDAKGKPATVDGVPTWAASNSNCIDSVTAAADGMSATIHILDNVDASNLTVTADVDMGSGVTNTDFVDTVSVIAGDAASATFAFGALTPDP
jgi:hypothetical protein